MTTTNMFLNFGGKWDSPPLCNWLGNNHPQMNYSFTHHKWMNWLPGRTSPAATKEVGVAKVSA